MAKLLLQASGSGNMGDVADPDSICRFTMNAERWQVVYIRWKVTGAGGDAPLSIKVDRKHITGLHTYLLTTLASMGDTGDPDMNLRIMPEEAEQWEHRRGDEVVVEWANPAAGTMIWSMEIELRSVNNA